MLYDNLEIFLDKLKEGRILTGSVTTFTDPAVTEIAAEAGFDFCWIDGEHGILDRNTAMLHMMALKGTGVAPFYRVPACDHTEIKRIIDLAPAGIIVPMILTAEDAAKAVAACRYPLEGTRGAGFRRGTRYGSMPLPEYLERAKRAPLVILQIEHIEACRNIDAILAVPGVDSILIGPYDLSCTMGKCSMFSDPEVKGTIDMVCRKARAAGKILGAYAEGNYEVWAERGVQYIGIINDTNAMSLGFATMIKRVKAGFGEKAD